MRKDVRMGFGVGSILLAVIIVSVLIIHKNRNSSKAVAFDAGKAAVAPSSDATPPADNTLKAPDNSSDSTPPQPIARVDATSATPPPAAPDAPKPPTDDATDKTGARWDALFATTDDPVKSQMTPAPAKARNHSSAQSSSSKQEMGSEAVANGQIESGSQPAIARSAPVVVVAPRHTSSGTSRAEGMTTHKVQPGETFVSISRAAYGDGRYFQAIVDANPKVQPQKLRPGMIIDLPPASQVKKAKSAKSLRPTAEASSGSALASDRKTYTVQNGDNLYKIARKLYGKGEKSADLYTLNKQMIGPDSTKLKIGMVLKLPEAPIATASR